MPDSPQTPTSAPEGEPASARASGGGHLAALRRLWAHLPRRRRAQCLPLLLLAIVTAIAEVAAIAAAMPFLVALAAPEQLLGHEAVGAWLRDAGATDASTIRTLSSGVFAAVALMSGLLRIVLSRAATAWSFAVGAELDARMFDRSLHQPYAVHISRPSSEVIAGATEQSTVLTYQVIAPCLAFVNASLMMGIVLAALVAWRPLAALAAFAGFLAVYGLVAVLSRRRLAASGEAAAVASERVVRLLQEGLGGIRDVLIGGTQEHYSRRFAEESRRLRSAQGAIQFLSSSPRFGVEALGMALIAGVAWLISRQGVGLDGALTAIGALAFSAQRLLPMLQEAYHAFTMVTGSQATLRDVLRLLDQPVPNAAGRARGEPLPFNDAIRLDRVGFRYGPDAPWVLRDVQLEIPRGARLGIVGTSGGGKSTLLDLIVGLQSPGAGLVTVDGVPIDDTNRGRWLARIAQVPQAIHLADCSIEENIAFAVPVDAIDPVRVREAARKARIADLVESMPDGYRSRVGERGVRLSGGQRQRLGIARALYKQADVLVLDEATSALDAATEREVIDTIEALGRDVTVIMVAHRLTTLERCDRILRVENGRIVPQPPTRMRESAAEVHA